MRQARLQEVLWAPKILVTATHDHDDVSRLEPVTDLFKGFLEVLYLDLLTAVSREYGTTPLVPIRCSATSNRSFETPLR